MCVCVHILSVFKQIQTIKTAHAIRLLNSANGMRRIARSHLNSFYFRYNILVVQRIVWGVENIVMKRTNEKIIPDCVRPLSLNINTLSFESEHVNVNLYQTH